MTEKDVDEMAAAVVLLVKSALEPLQARIATLEQRDAEQADRILQLEAALASQVKVCA